MPITDDVQAKDVTVDIRPGMACFFSFLSGAGGVPLHSITRLMPMLQALSPVHVKNQLPLEGAVERHSGRSG